MYRWGEGIKSTTLPTPHPPPPPQPFDPPTPPPHPQNFFLLPIKSPKCWNNNCIDSIVYILHVLNDQCTGI